MDGRRWEKVCSEMRNGSSGLRGAVWQLFNVMTSLLELTNGEIF